MPLIRPFRALRYRQEAVGDLRLVVSPPYDVISPEQQQTLLRRDPRNVVRLDLPAVEPGDAPDDRYRRAARTLASWRSDGTLHKDPQPSVYAYEQTYRVPGTAAERTQRGFFARLRLEPFGPESGVRPHERTLAPAREDRYRLLRATGVNTSPVVGLFEDRTGESPALLNGIATAPPDADVVDDDGVAHRMWRVPDDGTGDGTALALAAVAGRGPITIADGHHRYETALRYRDERRMSRSCEEDPAFDYLLALLLDSTSEPLTVLPTHRVVRGAVAGASLLRDAVTLFRVDANVTRDRLVQEFTGLDGGGRGRFGLWWKADGGGGAILDARAEAFEKVERPGGSAARGLRGSQGGRRDATEVDVFPSQAAYRPGHQPSRVVTRMPETTPESILARTQQPAAGGRPVRKDEIELGDRGLYIESWLPERRSRRKPLLFVHGELAGSWLWERFLGYFAGRGWEGHALNLRNHFWSQTADPTELSFETYTQDVVAAMDRLGPNTVAIGHGMGALLVMKAAERMPISESSTCSGRSPTRRAPRGGR